MTRTELKEWILENIDFSKTTKPKFSCIKEALILHTSYLRDVCRIKERIYHIINDLYEAPKCNGINCDNLVNFHRYNKGYQKYCSNKCSENSPEKLEINRKTLSKYQKGSTNGTYRGDVTKLDLPLYDTYSKQLQPIEEVRRDPSNKNLLQVKCTNIDCNKWFTPTMHQVWTRNACIRGNCSGESRFYCSDECKHLCPIFGRHKYPKGFIKYKSSEVDPELKELVLERDNYTCQKCGSLEQLQCHHIDPQKKNPIFINDIDSCIILCKSCHKWVHMNIPSCDYYKLRCDSKKI